MATIVTRAGKGSALTHNEVDANFNNLNNDKYEAGDSATLGASSISANTTTDALRITQTGTGNAFVVEDSASPDATPFVIDDVGQVRIGTSELGRAIGISQRPLQLFHTGTGSSVLQAGISTVRGGNNSFNSVIAFGKTRATSYANNASVQSGDGLGAVFFSGDDGTDYIPAATIRTEVDGTPGTNDMPGRLMFSTTPSGSATPVERMRIDSEGRILIGAFTATIATLGVFGNSRTNTVAPRGIRSAESIQDNATSFYQAYSSIPSTVNSTFTLPTLSHYDASQGTFGASSTVTNQYGFLAGTSLTGATNNYGFYGNIASGTGRWNFYANGTADNYFAGNVLVGAPTAISALLTAKFQITGNTNNSGSSQQIVYSVASNSPRLTLGRAKTDTIGGQGLVANNEILGDIRFVGSDGVQFFRGGAITCTIDGTAALNSMPARLTFSTTPSGSDSPVERMRIASGGLVSLASSAGLSISSTTVTSPAAADGNVFSGTYTPTLTNVTNVGSSSSTTCQYMRVGNIVTVSGTFQANPTAAGNTELGMSLPIASSFSTFSQLGGTAQAVAFISDNTVSINSDSTNNRAQFRWVTNRTTNTTYVFSFTYRIA